MEREAREGGEREEGGLKMMGGRGKERENMSGGG